MERKTLKETDRTKRAEVSDGDVREKIQNEVDDGYQIEQPLTKSTSQQQGFCPITTGLAIKGVIAGVSLLAANTDQISRSIGTSRNVTIEITNTTDTYILANPETYADCGSCHIPPESTIAKKTKEACSFSKTSYSTFGVEGVLTYQILSDERVHVGELAIMFSVPYGVWADNYLALGIYQPNARCDHALFDQMYRRSGPFTRGKGTGSTIRYSGKGVAVSGTMSPSGQSIIKVEFKVQ